MSEKIDPYGPPRPLLSIASIAAWTAPLAIVGHVFVNGFDADAPAGAIWLALVAVTLAVLTSFFAMAWYRLTVQQRRTVKRSLIVAILSFLTMLIMPSIHYN